MDKGSSPELNNQDQANIENSFCSNELLLEEERLKSINKTEDKTLLIDNLDKDERNKRYQNLLALLENSINITNLFETRLKICKSKIISDEIEKNKKINESIISKKDGTSSSSVNEETDEEMFYSNLFKQPKLFNGKLKNHQIEGLLWIRTLFENGLNGILADDMGLGKTIQTIAFYCFLIEMGIPGPFLIIAPLSTIPNWLSEFTKFSPQLSTLLYHGSEEERRILLPKFKTTYNINNFKCYPVVITSYEIVRFDISYLRTTDWKFIAIDEGQKLKNFNASISKCMREFKCLNKLILTGTPIQNDMSELWALLNLLMPKLFDKLEDFNSWFVIENFFDSNDKIASMAQKDKILDILLKVIKPFILRREKKETDLNLPKKKEIVIYAPMTETQHELYKATLNKHMDILLKQNKAVENIEDRKTPKRKCTEKIKKYTQLNAIKYDIKEPEVKEKSMAISVIMQNPFMQLKKIANHPYLVHLPLIPGTQQVLVDENIVKSSGKFQVLDAMLSKLKLLGHKVLLFSTMTQILDIIEEFLIFRTYKYTRLDGNMKVQTRVDAMKEFNDDPDCFLMIISTRAGGLGLNLTSADTVIIFDSDWNPQNDLQAQDRCHRMGQKKPVVVYRLCSKNTVDEKILERGLAKRKLEKIIIGHGSFNRNSKLDVTSIEELLRLLESSDFNKKIQSNGFIFTDEELDALLDRSDMVDSTSQPNSTECAEHFKVLASS